MRRFLHVGVGLLMLAAAAGLAAPAGRADDAGAGSEPELDLYRIRATPAEVRGLGRVGIDVVAIRAGGIAEAVLTPPDVARVTARGLRPIRWRDAQGRSVADLARDQAAGGYIVWRSWDQPGGLRDELAELARKHPDLVRAEVIGRSVQGRDILAVRVTGDAPQVPDGARPAVLYISLQHSREWISGEITRRLLHSVVDTYGIDPDITHLLDETELWFIVVANPDGYELTFDPDQRLWRKNAADNDHDGQLTYRDGVDINRNFPDHWGYTPAGSATVPEDQSFRGPAAGSEPETQALIGLAGRVHFRFMVNYHSYGQLMLYPIGWQEQTPTADQPIYAALAGTTVNPAIPGYKPKLSTELYPTNGETASWADAQAGALAYTIELGEGLPGSGFAFPDNEALIELEYQLNRPFALDLARSAADPAHPVSHLGNTAPAFVVDRFGTSYGDPQPVQATVARHLGPVTVHWQAGDGPEHSAPAVEWAGGIRYGGTGNRYYHRVRGTITGARPGDSVRVWFRAGGERSDEFTYRLEAASGRRVLVVVGGDHSWPSGPVPGSRTSGNARERIAPVLDALAANGVAADAYDVDGQGHIAPDPLGVLGHYEAVVWTADEYGDAGDEPTAVPGIVPRVANAEMLALRDYLNEGGRLLYGGRGAGAPYARRDEYNPTRDGPCLPTSGQPRPADAEGTVDAQDQCVALSDEFFVSWLGAYEHVSGGGAASDGGLSPVRGVDVPFLGLGWAFGGAGVARGDSAAAYIPTADTFGAAYPHLGGHGAARYRAGPPPTPVGRSLPPRAAAVTTPSSILFGFGFEDIAADQRAGVMARALTYLLPRS